MHFQTECNDLIDELRFMSRFHPSTRWRRTSLREDGSGSAYDKESMAIIKLNNTTVLYLKEVTKFLALVCILREESFERKGKPSPPAAHYCAPSRVDVIVLCLMS